MKIMGYLLILLTAHTLGDFYFQTEKLAEFKARSYKGVLLHSLEYLLVSFCVTLPIISFDMILAATYLAVIHFFIDTFKYIIVKRKQSKTNIVFACDQIFHVLSILILAYIMYCWNFEMSRFHFVSDIFAAFGIVEEDFIRWILVLLILGKPTNILIQNLLLGNKPIEKESVKIIGATDNKAGRKIGLLERLIMLLFISMNQYVAMAFVLTAKSIARYDKISKDEKFAEYYLLGTLLSTASVIICKVIFL